MDRLKECFHEANKITSGKYDQRMNEIFKHLYGYELNDTENNMAARKNIRVKLDEYTVGGFANRSFDSIRLLLSKIESQYKQYTDLRFNLEIQHNPISPNLIVLTGDRPENDTEFSARVARELAEDMLESFRKQGLGDSEMAKKLIDKYKLE